MKELKKIRILASVVCFTAAILYVILCASSSNIFTIEEKAQIVPSRIFLPVTLGATLFWVVVTIVLGRVYCSSICPLGTLQDAVIAIRRKLYPGSEFRYKKPRRLRFHFLIIYLICLFASVEVVCLLMEPWPLFTLMGSLINRAHLSTVWAHLGLGVAGGIVAGVVSLVGMTVWAAFRGRDFCNVYCPVGTFLGAVSEKALYQVRFDPDKCISCMKCEEVCKASCIRVSERRVDNDRCVRCFDCIDVCPNNAIRFQKDANKAATPLAAKS